METKLLETQMRGAVLEVTLNRPSKLNALTRDLLRQLLGVFESLEHDVRAVLLTGSGRGFCAGQDLSEFGAPANVAPQVARSLDEFYHPLIQAIGRARVPVVAALNGLASGAGTSLALACDMVIAGEAAQIDLGFSAMGLVPDCGATHIVPRLVGRARAAGLMLLGEPISGAQAAQWGLIWRAVPDENLMKEAREIAQKLAGGAGVSHRLIKQALRKSGENTLAAQLDLERDLQVQAAKTRDFARAVEAFKAKTKPEFEGR
ncbi:MAG: enoyl-CoA hydratase-related protein [Alphaproteobacteria bacterium]